MAKSDIIEERRYAAPRELVWALLSDSDRFNRAMGFAVPSFTWREVEGQRRLVGTAKQSGLTISWAERPYEWVEGRFFRAGRDYLNGPAANGGTRVEVESTDDGGCTARITLWGNPRGWLLRVLTPLISIGLRRRMRAYMRDIAELLERPDRPGEPIAALPPTAIARQLLIGTDESTLSGRHTPVDGAELTRRRKRLESDPVDAQVVDRLVAALAACTDDQVAQMNPFELAGAWGLHRRDVLRAFLYATRAGLVDLNWQINCPVCRVSAQVAGSLAEVGATVHCDACNIRYDVDFGANVEAVFRCNRALRAVEPTVYCMASPSFRPHILAQLRVGDDAPVETSLWLHDGHVHVRTLQGQRAADLHQDVPPQRISIHVDETQVRVEGHGRADDEPTAIVVTTDLPEAHVLLERGGWSADTVLGSVVASLPEFVDLFATEAPAAGLELSIGNLTVLFSDLTGSTALYERIGDARAYAIVQDHFATMARSIERHEGALVKTMGDAVMATFPSPLRAVQAAIQMVEHTQARHAELGVGVKLGIHEGPCLAVRANDRLDFFGTTVNVAARLQGQAQAGRLVVLGDLLADPSIAALLGPHPQRRYAANLKGLSGDRQLVAIDLSLAQAPSDAANAAS